MLGSYHRRREMISEAYLKALKQRYEGTKPTIWVQSIKVHPGVRTFLWKLHKQCKDELHWQGISSIECQCFHSDVEDLNHVFWMLSKLDVFHIPHTLTSSTVDWKSCLSSLQTVDHPFCSKHQQTFLAYLWKARIWRFLTGYYASQLGNSSCFLFS